MEEITNLVYVDGNVFFTMCNVFVFVFVLEFFLTLINILRGIGK